MTWMNEHGITVYLKADPEQVLERVQDEKYKRPLLKKLDGDEVLLFIKAKMKEREPFYLQARIILPMEELTTASFEKFFNS